MPGAAVGTTIPIEGYMMRIGASCERKHSRYSNICVLLFDFFFFFCYERILRDVLLQTTASINFVSTKYENGNI